MELLEAAGWGFGIFVALFNIGISVLIIYILLYRIPKALIKFAIRTYFEEKRLHNLMCAARPGSQPTSSAPAYQTGQHGPER